MKKQFLVAVLAVGAALPFLGGSAVSQVYPDRPVKMVIGFGPGSTTDLSSRILGEELSRSLGQPIIVESKPGAASNIAAAIVSKSAPDGYTLFHASVANVINPKLKRGETDWVDPLTELAPVARVSSAPFILVVNPAVKATSVQELIALAKAEPGKLNYGSTGTGTMQHLSGELFKSMTDTNLVHVPYQAVGQAVQDLLAGSIQAMFLASSSALGHIEAKRLRALAWTTADRGSALADLPTLAESGLAGYETSLWSGITAPKGLPDAIRDKLSAAITNAIKSDAVAQAFRRIGIEPFPSEAAPFGAYMAAESAKWGPIIEKTGLGN